MAQPVSLSRHISPPPRRKCSDRSNRDDVGRRGRQSNHTQPIVREEPKECRDPSLAAVEAGEAQIRNHLDYFSKNLQQAVRPASGPRLTMDDFIALYERNNHERGRHFVIHQHDHPISGVHYDLRLQFSESSSLSFAVPYGLPGNPVSVRPIRMAVETRVHNLWNNLVESASHATGSLLIWDTGEYEVLPWREKTTRVTDDELPEEQPRSHFYGLSQNERLIASFRRRRIRLRLSGSKLPTNYSISMWLSSTNDRDRQPKRPKRKRRRMEAAQTTKRELSTPSDSDSEREPAMQQRNPGAGHEDDEGAGAGVASDQDEDATIRANNAYPGASNTIGSVHQRYWFLTLDPKNSGFKKAERGVDGGRWVDGFEPFFVLGRDHERSVVTGRNADEVMEDEGVERFVGRKMWLPILK